MSRRTEAPNEIYIKLHIYTPIWGHESVNEVVWLNFRTIFQIRDYYKHNLGEVCKDGKDKTAVAVGLKQQKQLFLLWVFFMVGYL